MTSIGRSSSSAPLIRENSSLAVDTDHVTPTPCCRIASSTPARTNAHSSTTAAVLIDRYVRQDCSRAEAISCGFLERPHTERVLFAPGTLSGSVGGACCADDSLALGDGDRL
ncbi:MAG: hypothetical protein ACXV8L_07600, partial [Ilumatobacteraceae bacterium]